MNLRWRSGLDDNTLLKRTVREERENKERLPRLRGCSTEQGRALNFGASGGIHGEVDRTFQITRRRLTQSTLSGREDLRSDGSTVD